MKKKILVILVVLLLTGCKVEYNLVIDENLKVKEEINMTGTDSFFADYPLTSKINVLKMMLDTGNRKEMLISNGYHYDVVEDNTPYIKVTKNYDSLDDYVDKTLFISQYFEKLDVINNNGIVTVKSEGFMPIEEDDSERYFIEYFTLKIQVPYKVTDSNAYKVDEKTNTYFWYITNTDESSSIVLTFDSSTKYNPYLKLILEVIVLIILVISIWIYAIKSKKDMLQ